MIFFCFTSFFSLFLKFRYSQKVTKSWKNLPLYLTLLCNFKKRGRFFSNRLAFSQYPNFMKWCHLSFWKVIRSKYLLSDLRNRENLTTISLELGFLWDFVRLLLKTCSLYHEKLFIQVVNDISSQVFNNFFSASDIMEAVRGRLCFNRYESKVAWYKLNCCEVCILRVNRKRVA